MEIWNKKIHINKHFLILTLFTQDSVKYHPIDTNILFLGTVCTGVMKKEMSQKI
jgi:hypothetical protein